VQRAEHLFSTQRTNQTPAQKRIRQQILGRARQIDGSLTHRAFQELVLGSRAFTTTYGLEPHLDTESYLHCFDRPILEGSVRDQLSGWLATPDHYGVIFTARPSAPLGDFTVPPEAEIGARLVGLDFLPVVGLGDLAWLGARIAKDDPALRKPSPVHALVALLRYQATKRKDALIKTANLVFEQVSDPVWRELDGAQVTVFEDTTAGLQSALVACELLGEIGISIRLQLIGVTPSEEKREALETLSARVFLDINQALGSIIDC
jgi:hypothetical protein